jgi:hypothetical protein
MTFAPPFSGMFAMTLACVPKKVAKEDAPPMTAEGKACVARVVIELNAAPLPQSSLTGSNKVGLLRRLCNGFDGALHLANMPTTSVRQELSGLAGQSIVWHRDLNSRDQRATLRQRQDIYEQIKASANFAFPLEYSFQKMQKNSLLKLAQNGLGLSGAGAVASSPSSPGNIQEKLAFLNSRQHLRRHCENGLEFIEGLLHLGASITGRVATVAASPFATLPLASVGLGAIEALSHQKIEHLSKYIKAMGSHVATRKDLNPLIIECYKRDIAGEYTKLRTAALRTASSGAFAGGERQEAVALFSTSALEIHAGIGLIKRLHTSGEGTIRAKDMLPLKGLLALQERIERDGKKDGLLTNEELALMREAAVDTIRAPQQEVAALASIIQDIRIRRQETLDAKFALNEKINRAPFAWKRFGVDTIKASFGNTCAALLTAFAEVRSGGAFSGIHEIAVQNHEAQLGEYTANGIAKALNARLGIGNLPFGKEVVDWLSAQMAEGIAKVGNLVHGSEAFNALFRTTAQAADGSISEINNKAAEFMGRQVTDALGNGYRLANFDAGAQLWQGAVGMVAGSLHAVSSAFTAATMVSWQKLNSLVMDMTRPEEQPPITAVRQNNAGHAARRDVYHREESYPQIETAAASAQRNWDALSASEKARARLETKKELLERAGNPPVLAAFRRCASEPAETGKKLIENTVIYWFAREEMYVKPSFYYDLLDTLMKVAAKPAQPAMKYDTRYENRVARAAQTFVANTIEGYLL